MKRCFVNGSLLCVLLFAIGSLATAQEQECQRIPAGDDVRESVGMIGLEMVSAPDITHNGRLSSAGLPDAIVRRQTQVGDTIDTEIISLNLQGNCPGLGRITVVESPTQASEGKIKNVMQKPYPDCSFESGDSFFDVFVEITLEDEDLVLIHKEPIPLHERFFSLPPPCDLYVAVGLRIPLYDKVSGDLEAYLVPPNEPPTADAGDDQNVEQESHSGTIVTLDGSGSTDDGLLQPLTYKWTEGTTELGVGVTLNYEFQLGEHKVTLTVDDGQFSDSDEVTIVVQDTTPPEIVPTDVEHVLWPPNHKYRTITISDCVAAVKDICDGNVSVNDVMITSVSSDEPEDAPGKGDGATVDDIVIVDPQTVKLRAERQGGGNGRVYTINYAVMDLSGNETIGSCKVSVPHAQSGTPAVDDGPEAGYTVLYP